MIMTSHSMISWFLCCASDVAKWICLIIPYLLFISVCDGYPRTFAVHASTAARLESSCAQPTPVDLDSGANHLDRLCDTIDRSWTFTARRAGSPLHLVRQVSFSSYATCISSRVLSEGPLMARRTSGRVLSRPETHQDDSGILGFGREGIKGKRSGCMLGQARAKVY
jgi:hypothetical protein